MIRTTTRLLILIAAIVFAACSGNRDRLRVAAAAGLGAPVAELLERFGAEHPERATELIVDGSVALARQIAAGKLEADVVFLADGALVGELLQPEWTSLQIRWAADRLVLARSGDARIGDDWAVGLVAPGIVVGRADPERSALGYRFDYVVRLHDRTRPSQPLSNALLGDESAATGYEHAAAVGEALRTGEVAAAFLYASMARDLGLRATELAPQFHLGAAHLAAVYAPVSVPSTDGRTPRPAAPIVHVIAVADRTPHREAALELLRLALDRIGGEALQAHGLEPVVGDDRAFSFDLPADIEAVLVATNR